MRRASEKALVHRLISTGSLAAVLLLSGCVGLVVHGNEQHRAENPILSLERARYLGADGVSQTFPVPTKAQVLAAWGRPDRIETSGTGAERWTYTTGIRWNGLVAFLGIPIPLLVPVGSDQLALEFAGDSVAALETLNNAAKAGGACGLFPGHDLVFDCGAVSASDHPGSQFLGGSRHLLPRNTARP